MISSRARILRPLRPAAGKMTGLSSASAIEPPLWSFTAGADEIYSIDRQIMSWNRVGGYGAARIAAPYPPVQIFSERLLGVSRRYYTPLIESAHFSHVEDVTPWLDNRGGPC